MPRSLCFLVVLVSQFFGASQTVWAGSWENFIEASLKKSPQVQQVRHQFAVPELEYLNALQQLEWNLLLDTGFRRDRSEVPSIVQTNLFRLDETFATTLNLSKSFLTGTNVTFTAAKQDIRRRAPFITGTAQIFANSYLLSLEQNFWRNAFGEGLSDRVGAAEKQYAVQKMQRKESLEQSLLTGAQLFWTAATLEVQYKESEQVLRRLETLVKNVERKSRVRYAAPGEYAQVQAQYFAQVQQVRLNKVRYEQSLNDLKLFLPDWGEADLKWKKDDPQFKQEVKNQPLEVRDTRAFQLVELQKLQAEQNAQSVESLNKPQFAFVGELGASGVDGSDTLADREWLEGRRPSYFVGLRFSHTFGSGARDAQVRAAKAQALAQQVTTDLEKQRLNQRAQVLTQEIISLEENLRSQESQLTSLRQAVRELTTSFNQGRIDINVLIDLINQAQTSERIHVEARANLELRYLEWQFLFDRIVID